MYEMRVEKMTSSLWACVCKAMQKVERQFLILIFFFVNALSYFHIINK